MIMMKRRDVGDIVKDTFGKGVEEQDKMKYKMLISEYRKFKTKNVKHLRFSTAAANLSEFGEFFLSSDKYESYSTNTFTR